MSKLLKYEFRKTLNMKLILLGITAVVELAFLAGLYLVKSTENNLLVVSCFLLFMLAMLGVAIVGLQSVLTLHHDMNTKESYMLFMTPNGAYKILGAKVLENGLSILLIGAFYFALGFLDITLLFAREASLQQLWEMIEQIIHRISQEVRVDTAGMACFFFAFLTSWIATVTAAFLADIVSTALLKGKRFNGVVTFALFILLEILFGRILSLLDNFGTINQRLLLEGGLNLVFAVATYVGAAEIMKRKLSV